MVLRSQNKRKRKNIKYKLPSLDLSSETKKSVWGVIFVFIAIFFILSFLGFGGKGGESISRVLNLFFGCGSWFLAILFLLGGIVFFLTERKSPYTATIIGGAFFLISFFSILELSSEKLGGFFGEVLVYLPKEFFGVAGAFVLFIALLLISISFLFNFPILKKSNFFRNKNDVSIIKPQKLQEGKANLKIKEITPQKKLKDKIDIFTPRIIKKKKKEPVYKTLPLALLEREENDAVAGNLRTNAQIIKRTFQNFGIDVEMGGINIGPSITQYTFKPAEGIKLSKILSFQNDLALSLASHPIRIEAPIPGKSLVGIEVPNQKRAEVKLANLLSFSDFLSSPFLSFPLGKNVMGKPNFSNLGLMPHLLVAGATGAGKTVFLNSLILSLLWRNSPQDLRFVLVDPKRVEFSPYAPLPHLLCPPIINHQKVVPVLKFLIKEMEDRFNLLHSAKKRDIKSYNEMVAERKEKANLKKTKNLFQSKDEKDEIEKPPYGLEKLPYIVLIIDELADIMMAKGKEFEAEIVRLAQMSRAVGIHLILATQRPSVEVLTGLIKANITSRVAFQVASQIDSRTILDMAGAERLLGKGDMLFLSGETPMPRRFQGAFISSQEIKKVVEYIEKTEKIEDQKLEESLEETLEKVSESESSGFEDGDDELYEEARRVVIQARKASTSFLQRRLRIGYSRAARIIDALEEKNVIGPGEGSKAREVYIRDDTDNDTIDN